MNFFFNVLLNNSINERVKALGFNILTYLVINGRQILLTEFKVFFYVSYIFCVRLGVGGRAKKR